MKRTELEDFTLDELEDYVLTKRRIYDYRFKIEELYAKLDDIVGQDIIEDGDGNG